MPLTGMCERPPSCRFSREVGPALVAVGADGYGVKKKHPAPVGERGLTVLVDGVGFSRMGGSQSAPLSCAGGPYEDATSTRLLQ